MNDKLKPQKQCKISNLIKTISNISGKSLSEVEDEMIYCNLYPVDGRVCLRRFTMSTHDEKNRFNDTLNRILDINNLECLYIIKD